MRVYRQRRAVFLPAAVVALLLPTGLLPTGLLPTGWLPAAQAAVVADVATAVVETEPVLSVSDAADDVAIWRHPADPALSVIIGTDKRGGAVEVYDLAGARLQRIAGERANGVDIRHGVAIGGSTADLVAVGGDRVRFFLVDPATRQLVPVPIAEDGSRVPPNGICLYRSPAGKLYMFGISLQSVVDQLEITESGGKLSLTSVRKTFDVGSDAEACVADDEHRALYVNEADFNLWRYDAEPAGGATRTSVDKTGGGGHLVADIEGLTIVYQPGGTGYLIASSQGENGFGVYARDGANAYLGKFRVEGGKAADGCSNTDGIDAWAGNLGPTFPHGVFICQDHTNSNPRSGNQNFKLVRLDDIFEVATPAPSPVAPSSPGPAAAPPASAVPTAPTAAHPAPADGGGYWALSAAGTVHAFGTPALGDAPARPGTRAADIAATPTGRGYWVLDQKGAITARGDAAPFGGLKPTDLASGEAATSLSPTPTGKGYWIFTSHGRAHRFGDATHLGDMAGTPLNGAVLDSVATPTGHGYYMVAADGGIFAFGDAKFAGSMGGTHLNAPVRALVPGPRPDGYWLVAEDGGVFAFKAPFRGSMGGRPLNRPIRGMIRYGDGYLMVAADGGIFNFSDRPFLGSLGANPPAAPIVAVTATG
jgi:myo-inositol-hexaphosphate 3-phosphohydrolase